MIFLILCLMITLVFATITIAIVTLFTDKQEQRQQYMSKINHIGD